MSVAASWIKVGTTGNQSYYTKNEIYEINWQLNDLDFDDYVVAVAPNGGPIAMTQDSMKALLVTSIEDTLPFIYIYTSAGVLISKFIVLKLFF
jgi:vacuolar protein sorting-associated protein 16